MIKSWWPLSLGPEVFAKLLWFFDPMRDNIPPQKKRGEEQDRHEEISRAFLGEFIEFAWGLGSGKGDQSLMRRNPHAREMYLKARPQLIEILMGMGQLNWLINGDVRIEEFDEALFAKLRELALQKDWSDKGDYASLDETAAHGNDAALTLIGLEAMKREHDRLEAIARVENERGEEKRRLAEIERLRKARAELDEQISELTEPTA